MSGKSITLVASALLLLVAIAFGAWWFVVGSRGAQIPYSSELTPYSVLTQKNMAFVEAEQLVRAGDYRGARDKYIEALRYAQDSVQKSQIQYKIAATSEYLGDYVGAIRELKEIVADTSANDVFRSYAVMKMGSIFNAYGFGQQLDPIVEETFKGEPYASFRKDGDVYLAYRRLYEYSSSFYPVALSELRIADWYANYIRSKAADSTYDELRPDVEIVLKKIANAAKDVKRIEKDPNEVGLLPDIYTRQGEIFAKLASLARAAGEPVLSQARDQGITFEVAEDSYERGLLLRSTQGAERGLDGMERFMYSSFLQRYFPEREDDIREIIAPFYKTNVYRTAPVAAFLRSQAGADSWMNKSLVGMAAIDPQFKGFLISMGWTEADF